LLGWSLATTGLVYGIRPISAAPRSFGILASTDQPDESLTLFDPTSGQAIYSFDPGRRPNAAWATPLPGVALARTETTLAIVDGNDGTTRSIAVPETVAPNLSPRSIQFRGSAGYERILVGTPNFDADTYLIDLLTGERLSVIGMLGAERPPVSIQNVAVAADDRHLLAWDGRTTWVVDLGTRVSRVLGSGQFTFSAQFSDDGSQLVYSQQLASGPTQLLLQDTTTQSERIIGESATNILVSLWIPSRGLLLLDERTDEGGTLAVLDPATGNREDILEYTGATNIVQLSPDGSHALAGIEGARGRDWYQLSLSLTKPASRLLTGLTDAVISPGFDFHAAWALALPPTSDTEGPATSVKAIDLATGTSTVLIPNITSDAELSGQVVAPSGNAALLTIDSFTELAVHYLRLDEPDDVAIDLVSSGTSVIAPDGSGFAVSSDSGSAGSTSTTVYDQAGTEGAVFPGRALAWI
jgi:hypothetical protein